MLHEAMLHEAKPRETKPRGAVRPAVISSVCRFGQRETRAAGTQLRGKNAVGVPASVNPVSIKTLSGLNQDSIQSQSSRSPQILQARVPITA